MFAQEIDTAIEMLLFSMRSQIATKEQSVGGTVSLIGKETPETGYMVGGYVDSLIFDVDLLSHGNVAWQMITRWLGGHFAFATKFDVFLGGWLDTDTNLVYIDLSQHFEDERDALAVAAFQDEIAIWDLGAKKEIQVAH